MGCCREACTSVPRHGSDRDAAPKVGRGCEPVRLRCGGCMRVRPSSPPLFFSTLLVGIFLRSHQLRLTVCCAPFFNGWISRSATPGRTAPRRLDEEQQLQNNTLAAPLSRPTALGRRENWSRGCLEMHAPHCTAPHRTSPLRLSNPFFFGGFASCLRVGLLAKGHRCCWAEAAQPACRRVGVSSCESASGRWWPLRILNPTPPHPTSPHFSSELSSFPSSSSSSSSSSVYSSTGPRFPSSILHHHHPHRLATTFVAASIPPNSCALALSPCIFPVHRLLPSAPLLLLHCRRLSYRAL